MPRKHFSLIIIPHQKGKSRTLSFSKKTIKVALSLGAFSLVVLVLFLIDYFTLSGTRQKYKDLLQKNREQEETIGHYQDSITELQNTITHFANYAKKLNIMAGLKSPDMLKEVGIGGGEAKTEQYEYSAGSSSKTDITQLKDINQKAKGVEKNLNTLVQFFEEQSLKLAATPTIWPANGWMTSAYGWRKDPFTGKRAFHSGVDIATHYGNPVYATADGVVVRLKREKIGGRTIILSHRGGYTTVYCHLSKFLVKPGQKVKRGDIIGEVGKTGKSLGPHVHYEVRVNGKTVNPYYYILEE
ncbi:MAG: M23 family metallopeptidase [Candidatus Aminicenantes bacterium]